MKMQKAKAKANAKAKTNAHETFPRPSKSLRVQNHAAKKEFWIPNVWKASDFRTGWVIQSRPILRCGVHPSTPALIRLKPSFSKKIQDNFRYDIFDRF